VAGQALRGQTNFAKSLFRFNGVFNPERLLADHAQICRYDVPLPPGAKGVRDRRELYVLEQARNDRPPRARAS